MQWRVKKLNSKDALKRKVDELKKQAEEIEELGVKLLEETASIEDVPEGVCFHKLGYHSTSLRKMQRELILKYQQWYSICLRLVDEYAPEWREDFKLRYSYPDSTTSLGIIEFLNLGVFSIYRHKHLAINEFVSNLETQLSILLSIPSVIEIRDIGLRKLITAEVSRTEIEQAELLLESGFERAAGSVAGVALELHLRTFCDVNGVSYKPKATIEPLLQALYNEKKLDITEVKHIQYLASIRNKCSHSEPVSAKEVQSLIDGIKRLI